MTLDDALATIKEDSALLADWAEEPTAISNVDADNCRARIVAAVESVEAEIARLEQERETANQMGYSAGYAKGREAAEAEIARLKDGLRRIEELAESPSWDDPVAGVGPIVRALLAEHGASREDYEACCDHDRIVGRDVICELPAGHDGEHRMGGARWLRAEDGAA